MGKSRVAVIGLDGAAFEILDPLLRAGSMPNLERLIARGTTGTLLSTVHPLSPPAWTSFMTGVNPGKHGVFDFMGLTDRGDFRVMNGGVVQSPTLWRYASDANLTSVVVNVPMTYPPEKVQGAIISGMDSPRQDRAFTFPEGLGKELELRFGRYRSGVRARTRFGASSSRFLPQYITRLVESVASRAQVAEYLLEQMRPDLMVTVFTATDRAQHALGHLMAAGVTPEDGIGRVYRACDEALGRLLNHMGDEWNVLVMSDHGSCTYNTVFELGTWLVDRRWLQLRPPRRPVIPNVLEPLVRRLAGRFVLPQPKLVQFAQRIVWEETRAFAMGAFGSIYVATRERFPQGIVTSASEYESVCSQIADQLLSLRDPESGTPVVEAVHRASDVYTGAYTEFAPDLLVETRRDYFVRSNLDHQEGHIFYRAGGYQGRSLAHTGRHTPEGILIAAGPAWGHGTGRTARILDVAPTALYLLGVPIPEQMDGGLLVEWLDQLYHQQNLARWTATPSATLPPSYGESSYSEHDTAAVERRLRDLGYLG